MLGNFSFFSIILFLSIFIVILENVWAHFIRILQGKLTFQNLWKTSLLFLSNIEFCFGKFRHYSVRLIPFTRSSFCILSYSPDFWCFSRLKIAHFGVFSWFLYSGGFSKHGTDQIPEIDNYFCGKWASLQGWLAGPDTLIE